LKQLTTLSLVDCIRVTDLSPLRRLLPPIGELRTLFLRGCVGLPSEIRYEDDAAKILAQKL
jgi:hypothetical protein